MFFCIFFVEAFHCLGAHIIYLCFQVNLLVVVETWRGEKNSQVSNICSLNVFVAFNKVQEFVEENLLNVLTTKLKVWLFKDTCFLFSQSIFWDCNLSEPVLKCSTLYHCWAAARGAKKKKNHSKCCRWPTGRTSDICDLDRTAWICLQLETGDSLFEWKPKKLKWTTDQSTLCAFH